MIYKQVVFLFNFGVTPASNGKESYTKNESAKYYHAS